MITKAVIISVFVYSHAQDDPCPTDEEDGREGLKFMGFALPENEDEMERYAIKFTIYLCTQYYITVDFCSSLYFLNIFCKTIWYMIKKSIITKYIYKYFLLICFNKIVYYMLPILSSKFSKNS